MNYNYFFLLLCWLNYQSKAMEKEEQKLLIDLEQNEQTTPSHETQIPIQQLQEQKSDPKNSGDISIWFYPKYTFAEKFSGKNPDEVESVLNELITQENAPFKHKERLKQLREIITSCAVNESTLAENNYWVYLTCTKDNALKLRSALESQNDLVGKMYVYELSKLDYQQQKNDINKIQNAELNAEKIANDKRASLYLLAIGIPVLLVILVIVAIAKK